LRLLWLITRQQCRLAGARPSPGEGGGPYRREAAARPLPWTASAGPDNAASGGDRARVGCRRCTLPPMAGIHERYERLLETGLTLAAELSLPAALQRIVELAAELTGARYGALGVLGRDGTISELITTGMTQEQRAAIGHIPVGRGILGVLIDGAGTGREDGQELRVQHPGRARGRPPGRGPPPTWPATPPSPAADPPTGGELPPLAGRPLGQGAGVLEALLRALQLSKT
jgi:hypothetical protein